MSSPNGNDPNKPRLSDAQKKQNHIVSEAKRREAIREQFDRLADIVPGMEGQGRSEAVVLQATVEYMREQLAKKEDLRVAARKAGISDERFEKAYQQKRKGKDGKDSDGEDDGEGGRGGQAI